MASCEFWNTRFDRNSNMYNCPWCDRQLKARISQSEKNPGKTFVSCSKDHGGCGLFCFLGEEPNDKFKPGAAKRPRGGGNGQSFVGAVAAAPPQALVEVAKLQTETADLRAAVADLTSRVAMLEEN